MPSFSPAAAMLCDTLAQTPIAGVLASAVSVAAGTADVCAGSLEAVSTLKGLVAFDGFLAFACDGFTIDADDVGIGSTWPSSSSAPFATFEN
jgi:hypothetical protein